MRSIILIGIILITLVTGCHSNSSQVTTISWKGIYYGQSFFDLYVTVNGEDYYLGNYFGENLYEYEDPDEFENILTRFRGIWTGAGSDFYIKLKSDSELAIMYHDIEYGSNPSEWIEYDEMLVIPIKKDTEIQINEPVIFRGEIEGEPDAVG